MQNKSRPLANTSIVNVQQFICKKKTLSSSYTPVLLAPYQSSDCIIGDGQSGAKVIDHVANKTLKSYKVFWEDYN